MTLQWTLAWWNLIFILPFGLALLYLLLYAASGLTFGETEAEVEFDHDVDVAEHDIGADHDLDADHDVDADHEVDADHDADSDADHDTDTASPARAALHWLGVGRVPLSILLMVLILAWGASGFLANQLLRDRFAEAQIALVSIPIALAVSLLTTRFVVRGIVRFIPLDETTARRRHDLLGLRGAAMYDITDRFGMVSVRDDRGELYQVPCRVEAGQPPIKKAQTAVLVSFNARERLFHVMPAEAVHVAHASGL